MVDCGLCLVYPNKCIFKNTCSCVAETTRVISPIKEIRFYIAQEHTIEEMYTPCDKPYKLATQYSNNTAFRGRPTDLDKKRNKQGQKRNATCGNSFQW
jgi:hypothetical protein